MDSSDRHRSELGKQASREVSAVAVAVAVAAAVALLVVPRACAPSLGASMLAGRQQGFHAGPTACSQCSVRLDRHWPMPQNVASDSEWKKTARHKPLLLLGGTVEPRARLTVAGRGALRILAVG